MKRAILALTIVSGCSDSRTVGNASDGATHADHRINPERDATVHRRDRSITQSDAPIPPVCLMAFKFGECCNSVVPASSRQLVADPCLVGWPNFAKRPADCKPPLAFCEKGLCAPPGPFTKAVGDKGDGTCTWKSGCESPADCMVAVDSSQCCACPKAYPRKHVEDLKCLISPESRAPAECLTPCPAIPCPVCAPEQPLSCGPVGRQLALNVKGCWAGTPPP